MSEQQVIQARPTLYKGIRMRSRLEADFAAYLDRTGRQWQNGEWEYEPECFGSGDGQWLPDFRLLSWNRITPVYVELKPAGLLDEWFMHDNPYERIADLMRKMEIARQSQPECALWLVFWKYGDGVSLFLERVLDMPWLVSDSGSYLQFQWPDPQTQSRLWGEGWIRKTEHGA